MKPFKKYFVSKIVLVITKIVFSDQLDNSGLTPSIKDNRDTALCCLSDKHYIKFFSQYIRTIFLNKIPFLSYFVHYEKQILPFFCTLLEIVKHSSQCSTSVLTLVVWTKVCGCGLRPFKCDDPPFTTHNKGCVVNGPAEYEVHLAKAYKRYTILRLLNSKPWIG